jgi:hypothetical protein
MARNLYHREQAVATINDYTLTNQYILTRVFACCLPHVQLKTAMNLI